MILCFFINQIILYIHPLPSPTLYGYLDSGTSDIHRGGPASASYASLSMGIQPQRNTLCYISWPSPVSVINHKTMKAINRSLPTLTPLPNNLKIILLCISVCFLPIFGAHFTVFGYFHNERPFAEYGNPMFLYLTRFPQYLRMIASSWWLKTEVEYLYKRRHDGNLKLQINSIRGSEWVFWANSSCLKINVQLFFMILDDFETSLASLGTSTWILTGKSSVLKLTTQFPKWNWLAHFCHRERYNHESTVCRGCCDYPLGHRFDHNAHETWGQFDLYILKDSHYNWSLVCIRKTYTWWEP